MGYEIEYIPVDDGEKSGDAILLRKNHLRYIGCSAI